MLFDRRAVLTQIADKAAVRSYVESRLGPQVLPKLYYLMTRPNTIPFDQLPDRFVVKPTHGSGWVQIVTDKSELDRAALIETCTGWLNQNYYEITREWVYKNIEPRIVSGDIPRPTHLAEMLAAAKTLCRDLDFVRADFYDTAERLYFGGSPRRLKAPWVAFARKNLTAILAGSGSCKELLNVSARLT
jgi:hypothetical protein